MGLSYSEDPMIVAGVILTQCQRVTDRRTDGFTIASRALSITRYADALQKTKNVCEHTQDLVWGYSLMSGISQYYTHYSIKI